MSGSQDHVTAVRTALSAIAKAAASAAAFSSDNMPPAQMVEAMRHQMHRVVDDVIDAELLRHPDPSQPIPRWPRYKALIDAFRPVPPNS